MVNEGNSEKIGFRGRRFKNLFVILSLCLLGGGGVVSCGIEDYFYLYPVPLGNIQIQLNSRATVGLPNIDLQEFYYFTHFTVYYRIYISEIQETASIQLSTSSLSRINSALSSDYFAISPYTTTNTQNAPVNTSINSIFGTRNYYALALANADIENAILSSSSLGRTLEIEFDPIQTGRQYPYLTINGLSYDLFRSDGNGVFNPLPDRYFVNSSQLNSSQNATTAINADVVNKNVSGPRYTYVSMYIVVTGIDNNFSPINSIPTHIGIFRLPDPL
jgi:hypothetical protein